MSATGPLVVDASSALAVALEEEGSTWVRDAIAARSDIGARVVVPEIFWLEIANTLARTHAQPLDVVLESIATLDQLGLVTVVTRRPGLLATITAVIEHGLSAYDATYLALAEAVEADLLTLDTALADAAGDRALRPGGGEIRERRTTYRLQPWITWDDAADYLAAVREVTFEEARGHDADPRRARTQALAPGRTQLRP